MAQERNVALPGIDGKDFSRSSLTDEQIIPRLLELTVDTNLDPAHWKRMLGFDEKAKFSDNHPTKTIPKYLKALRQGTKKEHLAKDEQRLSSVECDVAHLIENDMTQAVFSGQNGLKARLARIMIGATIFHHTYCNAIEPIATGFDMTYDQGFNQGVQIIQQKRYDNLLEIKYPQIRDNILVGLGLKETQGNKIADDFAEAVGDSLFGRLFAGVLTGRYYPRERPGQEDNTTDNRRQTPPNDTPETWGKNIPDFRSPYDRGVLPQGTKRYRP